MKWIFLLIFVLTIGFPTFNAFAEKNSEPSISVCQTLANASTGTIDLADSDGVVFHVLKNPALLTISDFTSANVSTTEGQIVLNIMLKEESASRLQEFSTTHVGATMAFVVNGKLIRAPKIKDPILNDGFLIGPLGASEADGLANSIHHHSTKF